jgi:hypothetical protein
MALRDRSVPSRLTLAAWLILGACSDLTPQVAPPTPDASLRPEPSDGGRSAGAPGATWDRSLQGLRAQDQRVADVAYRIAKTSAALCSDQAPLSGLLLQSALQYRPGLRPAARAAFHLDDRPAVEAVAAGSPADAAGVRREDIVLAVNDRPLPTATPALGADTRPATYQPVEQARAAIEAALAAGPANLTLQRGDAVIRISLPREVGCAYDAQVLPGPALNASADGRHVFISSAMVDYAASDAALAFVLGHEFAHDVLHHRQRLDDVGFARKALGELGSTPASLQLAEREADYVGLYLAARAGYDISAAPDFWRRYPAGGELGWSHPSTTARAASLAATRDEIETKIRLGQQLLPTGLKDQQLR